MTTVHSIISNMPGHDSETFAPVRDDRALGEHEDLDRQPDGVPHSVVGLTAGFSTVLALLVAFMFLIGGVAVKLTAVLLLLVAIPVLVAGLRRKAERDRDYVHPSR
jgi:hypothetical protein